MNERILELARQAGYTSLSGFDFANDLQEAFLKRFAELVYNDIMMIVAAQALSNHSALDVYKNLKRIYEEENQRTDG